MNLFKNAFALVGLLIPTFGLAQGAKANQRAALEQQIRESCGDVKDPVEYQLCVEIVEMDFAVIPHNEVIGGGHCPGSCKQAAEVPSTVE